LMALGAMPSDHPNYISMPGMHGSYAANMGITDSDLLIALGTLPLVLHRRAPLLVLAVIGAAGAAYALRDGSANLSIPLAIAAYSAAAHRDRRTVVTIALPIALAASIVMAITEQQHAKWIEVLIALIPVPGAPMLLGRVSYNRRRRIERDHVDMQFCHQFLRELHVSRLRHDLKTRIEFLHQFRHAPARLKNR